MHDNFVNKYRTQEYYGLSHTEYLQMIDELIALQESMLDNVVRLSSHDDSEVSYVNTHIVSGIASSECIDGVISIHTVSSAKNE